MDRTRRKVSAMADGFSVDRAALNETAQGINNTIGALKGLGIRRDGRGGARVLRARPAGPADRSTRAWRKRSAASAIAGRGASGRWSRTGPVRRAAGDLGRGLRRHRELPDRSGQERDRRARRGPAPDRPQAAAASWSPGRGRGHRGADARGRHDLVAGRQRGGPAVEGRGAHRGRRAEMGVNRTAGQPDRARGLAQPGRKPAFRAAAVRRQLRAGQGEPRWEIRSSRCGTTPSRPRV